MFQAVEVYGEHYWEVHRHACAPGPPNQSARVGIIEDQMGRVLPIGNVIRAEIKKT